MPPPHTLRKFAFYFQWKHQTTSGFLIFPGCIEKLQWPEMGYVFPFVWTVYGNLQTIFWNGMYLVGTKEWPEEKNSVFWSFLDSDTLTYFLKFVLLTVKRGELYISFPTHCVYLPFKYLWKQKYWIFQEYFFESLT